MSWFKKPKYTVKKPKEKKREIPRGLWVKCQDCGEIVYRKEIGRNMSICPKCNFHFTIGSYERIALTLDKGSFVEYDEGMASLDPLNFKGLKSYKEKIGEDQKKTGLEEAAITGEGKISGIPVKVAVTDSRFIMGSMGSVVGERIARAMEAAVEDGVPFISISGSGGGARMYEGILSLMQMAKVSLAARKMHDAGILFISVLTNPTMGGVSASFAFQGDVIIAEPKALIGFAGPRVIKQTIRQDLPEGFQSSEFMLEHGLIDMVVDRTEMKQTLTRILNMINK